MWVITNSHHNRTYIFSKPFFLTIKVEIIFISSSNYNPPFHVYLAILLDYIVNHSPLCKGFLSMWVVTNSHHNRTYIFSKPFLPISKVEIIFISSSNYNPPFHVYLSILLDYIVNHFPLCKVYLLMWVVTRKIANLYWMTSTSNLVIHPFLISKILRRALVCDGLQLPIHFY